jgi:hypothetical protein
MLLGMLRDDLVEPNGVERTWLGIVERSTSKPHIGADVGVSLGPVLVIETAKETDLIGKWFEGLGRLAKFKLAVDLFGGKPTPLVDAMLGLGQRHPIGGIQSAKPLGCTFDHLFSHGFQNRKRQGCACQTLKDGTSMQFGSIPSHGL